MKRTLSLAQKMKIAEWLKTNQLRLKGLTSEQATKVCQEEVGIFVSQGTLRTITKAAGLTMFDRSTIVRISNTGSWHDVASVLGKSILEIQDAVNDLQSKLGVDQTDWANLQNLRLIVSRYHNKVQEISHK